MYMFSMIFYAVNTSISCDYVVISYTFSNILFWYAWNLSIIFLEIFPHLHPRFGQCKTVPEKQDIPPPSWFPPVSARGSCDYSVPGPLSGSQRSLDSYPLPYQTSSQQARKDSHGKEELVCWQPEKGGSLALHRRKIWIQELSCW